MTALGYILIGYIALLLVGFVVLVMKDVRDTSDSESSYILLSKIDSKLNGIRSFVERFVRRHEIDSIVTNPETLGVKIPFSSSLDPRGFLLVTTVFRRLRRFDEEAGIETDHIG